MKPPYIIPEKLAKRIGGQVPIIWAPVPLLVFRQEDRETGAHNMGASPLARLSLLSMLNHGFIIELAMRFTYLHTKIIMKHCLGSTRRYHVLVGFLDIVMFYLGKSRQVPRREILESKLLAAELGKSLIF